MAKKVSFATKPAPKTTDELSLSRLNHWLPRIQAHPEVVQGTTEFHHQIADARLPQAEPVFHHAAALDTAVDVLNPESPLVECLVGPFLLQGQLPTAWLLRRHEDRHLGQRERQETQVLQQPAPRRQGIRCRVRNGLIMGTAAIGVTEKEDEKQGIDEQDLFHGVVFFLAAITRLLCNRVLGVDDAPCRPVMGKRGRPARRLGWAP
jgi:hypothetical protein